MSRTIPKLLLGASTGINLFSGISDAEEAWRVGMSNSNASLRDANLTEEAGAMDIQQFERQGRELIGNQKSAMAGMNMSFSGSAMDIMADTYAQLELQKRNTQRDTASRADAFRNEAANSVRAGANARKQNYLKAGGKLLSGANDFMSLF
ncbi:MAG: hypothetical protein JEY79_01010 [Pseudodesulfovibrio sp.]|nr:hypothetical protein [Pseudodesulfovibrio sp.]